MSKPSLVIILAEDERHQQLARRYLYKLQYRRHDIRPVALPNGRGSGVQWVLQRYATEVQKYLTRAARARTALIVAIDADTGHVDKRNHQLEQALEEAGLAVRGADSAIIHLIPKRNVETWIMCLSGEHVDELTDYSQRREVDALISAAADILFEWSRPNAVPPAHCVPSLAAAIPEVRRLE